jgi:hypothetical protein
MRKKIVGIILSILGIASLVSAFIYMNGPGSSDHLAALLARGVLGAIAFFAGIWLVDQRAGRRATHYTDTARRITAPPRDVLQQHTTPHFGDTAH